MENENTFVMTFSLLNRSTKVYTEVKMEFDPWLNDEEIPTIVEQFAQALLACGYQRGSIDKFITTGDM